MYKEAITKAIESIKSNPFIEMNEIVVNEPATPELIDTFELIAGIRLPEKVKAFYLFANGLKCIWSVKQNLSPAVMHKIKAEGEQKDYDYSKPLGAVNIFPLQDMLMDKYWKTPFQEPPEKDKTIQFNNQDFQLGLFAKQLKIFDAYYINSDTECMAFLTNLPINGENFYLIMLDNHLADWNQSQIIEFETYILTICENRFTIPCRKRLFSKKYEDAAVVIMKENIDKVNLVPALFK